MSVFAAAPGLQSRSNTALQRALRDLSTAVPASAAAPRTRARSSWAARSAAAEGGGAASASQQSK